MGRCIRLFLPQGFRYHFAFVWVVLALATLEAAAQSKATPPSKNKPEADVFQKASFKRETKIAEKTTCTIEPDGAITALVRNGVELSTSDDWDCDGVPDAYDNCVGIANALQTDANSNGIGDGCEAGTRVSAGRISTKKSEDRSRKTEKAKSESRSRKTEKKTRDRSRESGRKKSETSSRKKKPEDKKNISRKAAKTQKKKR